MQTRNRRGPAVWLVGDVEHPDFADSVALLRSTSIVGPAPPEFIVVAQSRPSTVGVREVERLRRSAPLAAIVSLCGSWCEGELRTGRPLAEATRLYWYEFPHWWRRRMELFAAGRLGNDDCGIRIADCGLVGGRRAAVAAEWWDSFRAIEDALRLAGWEAVWYRTGRPGEMVGTVHAGIWEGGAFDPAERERFAEFVRRMPSVSIPVVALLDFPRGDRCELARGGGVVAEVLGKPWHVADLVSVLERVSHVDCNAARVA